MANSSWRFTRETPLRGIQVTAARASSLSLRSHRAKMLMD